MAHRRRHPSAEAPVLHTSPNDAVPRTGREEVTVPPDAVGMRLDTWLSRLPGFPTRSRMQQLVKDGLVLCDGEPADKSEQLEGGETICIEWPSPDEPWPRPEPIPLDIVFEDEDLIVVNKQAGLITHPAAGNPDGTLVNAVLHHCPTLPGIYGVRRPGIVHRLDKDTTGLIVVAKTERAMVSLQRQIQARTCKRIYRAIVIGDPKWDSLRVEAAIGRDVVNRLKRAIDGPHARPAVSHFEVIRRGGHHTLAEARLETGRTHQIRIHMAHIGLPIAGDELYNGHLQRSLERLHHAPAPVRTAFQRIDRPMLHAFRLQFTHPALNRRLEFEVPLPEDMATVVGALFPGEDALMGVRRSGGE